MRRDADPGRDLQRLTDSGGHQRAKYRFALPRLLALLVIDMVRRCGLAADNLNSVIIVDAPPFLAAVLESFRELRSLPGVRVLLEALQDARSSRA